MIARIILPHERLLIILLHETFLCVLHRDCSCCFFCCCFSPQRSEEIAPFPLPSNGVERK